MIKRVEIVEAPIPGKRLGRHVEHDELSRGFPFAAPHIPLTTVHHRRYGHPFDQGDLGSCTGNAAAGCLNSAPFHVRREKMLTEQDAVSIYELATQLDGFPGQYPPDDTGSSGLAAAKAAMQKGYIHAYRHAFNLDDALAALMLSPVIVGVNWYEGFDTPGDRGRVEISGQVRGGHEFQIKGFEHLHSKEDSILVAENSWGTSYGMMGVFTFTVKTFEQLLAEQGDVTIFFS